MGLLAACGTEDSTEPPGEELPELPGVLSLTFSTMGLTQDRDGYTVRLGGDPISVLPQVTLAVELAAGQYPLEISGIARNCHRTAGDPDSVTVVSQQTTAVLISVTCDSAWANVILFTRTKADSLGYPSIYRINPDGSDEHRIGEGQDPSLSADGTRLAFSTRFGPITIRRVDGEGEPIEIETDGYSIYPRFSPDGTALTYTTRFVSDSVVFSTMISDPIGSAGRTLTDSKFNEAYPLWSEDSRQILVTRWTFRSELVVIDRDGSRDRRVPTSAQDYTACDWRPGRFGVLAASTGGVRAVDHVTGESTLLYPQTSSSICPRWSPDGMHFVFSSSDTSRTSLRRMGIDRNGLMQLTFPAAGEHDDANHWVGNP